MSLISILASDVSKVFAFVNQFAANPILAGVPIQCFKYVPSQEAAVSKHVLVDMTAGKKQVNDNIAPGPHQWQIEGYIGGEFPFEAVGRYDLMPSINTMRNILDTAFQSRMTVSFVDRDHKVWPLVAIESFEQEIAPDVDNRLLVRLTIQELTVLSVTAVVNELLQAALPDAGSIEGLTAPGPSAAAELLPVDSPVLAGGDDVTSGFLAGLRGAYVPR
jgi:hypothetical protein